MSKRQVSNYPEEFKQSSAELAYNSSKSISQVANDLGVNLSTLHGWVKKYYPNQPTANLKPSSNDVGTAFTMFVFL